MIQALNSQSAINMRRCQDAVKVFGGGMIVFAFWAIAKFLLQMITGSGQLTAGASGAAVALSFLFVGALMVLDTGLRIYAWRASLRAAYGKPVGNRFLIVLVLMLVYNLILLLFSISSGPGESSTAAFVMENVVDLTDDVVMAMLLIRSLQLRKYRKLAAEEE